MEDLELLFRLGKYVLVIILFLLVFREGICWFWKINERVDLLKEIRDSLTKRNDKKENDEDNKGDKDDDEVRAFIHALEKNKRGK